jgi:predicted aconitase with swiveling domain
MQEQARLRREVVRLKREMKAISAQDEFSKWAKVRRQHDKALEEHDRKGKTLEGELLS